MSAREIPSIAGKRCNLRELALSDAPSLQRYADDLAVWRNLFEGFPNPYTLPDAQAWCTDGSRQPAMGLVWGIEVEQHIVGCISIRPDSGWLRCNAEVGYWLGQAHWRRGIASEALSLVTAWTWQHLPQITRIYAPIFAWNAGSQAVAKHCGYLKEGEFKRSAIKADEIIDRVQWAAIRP